MENKETVFILPTGDRIMVDERAIIYHNLHVTLPKVVNNSVCDALVDFLSYLEGKATPPSTYLKNEDFEYLEGSSEELLQKTFAQIPFAMKAFLVGKFESVEVWLGGQSKLAEWLEPHFSYPSYRELCVSQILEQLAEKIQKSVESLNFSAMVASRKVHDLNNDSQGIIGTVVSAAKSAKVKNSFCSKCDNEFWKCAKASISLAEKRLDDVITVLLAAAVVSAIGTVADGMNILKYQNKIMQQFTTEANYDDLKKAMSLLPFEPLVIRRAMEFYGDENACISKVAERFGVNAKNEKVELLKEISSRSKDMNESDLNKTYVTFKQHVHRLGAQDFEISLKIAVDMQSRIKRMDVDFRTIATVEFPTRLEAAMTRNDIKWLSDIIGEDLTRSITHLTRKASFFKAPGGLFASRKKGTVDISERLDGLLAQIKNRQGKSPFLYLVERALVHARDYSLFAGNSRYESPEEARMARETKKINMLELFRNISNRQFAFRLDALEYLRLKAKGVFSLFSKSKSNSLEDMVIERYFGNERLKSLRTLNDFLQWQLGYDFFDPVNDAMQEISPEELPVGYVSTSLPREDQNEPILYSDDDAQLLKFKYKIRFYKIKGLTYKNKTSESISQDENPNSNDNSIEDRRATTSPSM